MGVVSGGEGGIATAAAHRFDGFVAGEAIVDGTSTRSSQDVGKRCIVEIAQSQIAIVIEATRHHRTIDKHTYLVAKRIAEDVGGILVRSVDVGPTEDPVVLEVDVLGQFIAVAICLPGFGDIPTDERKQVFVLAIEASDIPETEYRDDSLRGTGQSKTHDTIDILLVVGQAIALLRMERYLHLVRTCFEHPNRLGAMEQSAVGSQNRDEAFTTRHTQKIRKMAMKERFAHQVHIKETHLALKTGGEGVELLHRERMGRPMMFGAKDAIEIADVRDFEIATIDHRTRQDKTERNKSTACF